MFKKTKTTEKGPFINSTLVNRWRRCSIKEINIPPHTYTKTQVEISTTAAAWGEGHAYLCSLGKWPKYKFKDDVHEVDFLFW